MSRGHQGGVRKRRERKRNGQSAGENYSIEQIEAALLNSMGHISTAAKKLKCTYHCVRSYIVKYPQIEDTLNAIRESHIDLAESKLLSKVKAGNLDAAKYFLSRIGKNRGYTERTEVTGANGAVFGVTMAPAPGVSKEDMEGKEKG